MTRRNGSKASGDWSGRPSAGLRACRCTIAAPAAAAPSADSAISADVTGKCGDIEGGWIDPVTAQEMITLWGAMAAPSDCYHCRHMGHHVNLWKSGSRFSLKAATPSFDSAVS